MVEEILYDLMYLFVFLFVGFLIREVIKPLQKLFIPASVIGGLVALVLGQQLLGWVTLPETFADMPGPMINIVLTCMILGTTISRTKLKTYASVTNMVSFTYFAQLVVGVTVGILLSKVWTSLPDHWGIMSVFSFWGGHGAASAAGALFEELGVEGNLGIGIILATLGLIVAILVGMVLVNWGIRKGYGQEAQKELNNSYFFGGTIPKEKQVSIADGVVSSNGINSMALQFALIMLSIYLGTQIFSGIAVVIPAASTIPSLLYGMVGAAIIWGFMSYTKLDKYADKKSINTLSGIALEICICAAVATLNLGLVSTLFVPILIYTATIIILMVIIFVVFGKRWIKNDWFETNLIIFGQGIGSTPTGFTLARSVDPDQKTTAWEAFGVGIGVFVVISSTLVAILPLIAMKSDMILIGLGLLVALINIFLGETLIRKKKQTI